MFLLSLDIAVDATVQKERSDYMFLFDFFTLLSVYLFLAFSVSVCLL